MTTIFGTFYWTGDLPDDDDVACASEPTFSADFGEQWQYMATEPVIQRLCVALRLNDAICELNDPNPDELGWYTNFTVDGWTWFLFLQWVPDGDRENCFEFDVRLCNNWWHRIVHCSVYESRFRDLGAKIANALATVTEIEDVAFNRRAA